MFTGSELLDLWSYSDINTSRDLRDLLTLCLPFSEREAKTCEQKITNSMAPSRKSPRVGRLKVSFTSRTIIFPEGYKVTGLFHPPEISPNKASLKLVTLTCSANNSCLFCIQWLYLTHTGGPQNIGWSQSTSSHNEIMRGLWKRAVLQAICSLRFGLPAETGRILR